MRAIEPSYTELDHLRSTDSVLRATVVLPSAEQSDGMEIFRILWRHRGLIIGTTLAAVVLGATATFLMTPRYTSAAQVLVGVETPNVANIEAVLKGIAANQETVQSESYVLQSRSLAEQVVRRLALEKDPEFNPTLRKPSFFRRSLNAIKDDVKTRIVEPLMNLVGNAPPKSAPLSDDQRTKRVADAVTDNLLNRIDVVPLKRSHVLEIAAQSESPDLAARIAGTMANVYIEQQLVRKAHAAQRATGWLDQQIGDLRGKVESSERAVEEYRRANGLYETKSDTVTSQQLSELNTQMVLADSEKAAAEARLSQAKGVLRHADAMDSLPQVVNSPLIQSLKEKEVEIERNAAELSSTYGPGHPKIREIKAQLRGVKAKVKVEVQKVVDALQHEAQAAAARYQSLRQNVQQIQSTMGQMNEKAIRLHELERQAEANRSLLHNFLDRSKETSAQEGMSEPDATIISNASVPFRPSYPPTGMIILLAVIGGGLFGSLLALFAENLDRTFRTSEQIERTTHLPTLAMIPAVRTRRHLARYAAERPDSAFSEAVRNLNTQLLMSNGNHVPKLVMLTSAAPREGKSRIAIAMATLAAHAGRRVIIVDCDWKRPVVHSFFRHAAGPGLADLLSGGSTPEEAVYRDPATGVHAIFAGHLAHLESDPQHFPRLRLLFKTLARHYDLVVVDSPPVFAGSEVLPLSRMMDRVAFVVKWGSTPRDVVLSGLRQIHRARARVAGVVLSQVDPRQYRRYGLGEVVYSYGRPGIVRAA